MRLPTLFISHGSPMLLVEDTAARDFLQGYAKTLPKPRAIVIASAHFGTSRPAVVGDAHRRQVYAACASLAAVHDLRLRRHAGAAPSGLSGAPQASLRSLRKLGCDVTRSRR